MKARVGFVVEQALGHVAYGMNLRAALAHRSDLDIVWLEVPYAPSGLERLPLLRSNWTLRGSLRARRLLQDAVREAPLDAIFIHTQTVSLFAGGFMSRIPTLLSLDATPMNLDTLAGAYAHTVSHPGIERLKKRLLTRVVRRARQYTTWSRWAKDSLVADYGADASRVTVIHPGTTLAKFPEQRAIPAGMHDGPIHLLFVGGDFERKGGDLLLQVYREHLRGLCELHLVTAAVLPAEDGVHVYNGVKPHSEQLLKLYRESDVFVLPTRGDCLAVVLGEAMAAGLPIVTTPVGAHAEAVDEGASGFIVPVDDAEALRERLQRLANDRALIASMGARSRAIGEQRFDMATGAEQIADILATLAREGKQMRKHENQDGMVMERLA